MLYAIGLLWTTNMQEGGATMGLKASLLAFPLIVAQLGYKEEYLKLALHWFVASCFAAIAFCLVIATYNYTQSGDGSVFFYTKLSYFLHVGYYAMMLNFAIAILYNFWIKHILKTSLFIILTTILAFFVLMLSTKMGIIGLLFVIFYMTMHSCLEYKHYKKGAIIFIAGLAIVGFSTYGLPTLNKRINAASNTLQNKATDQPGESTASRIAVWKDAIQLAKANTITGVGTGDSNDALIAQYTASNNAIAIYRNYNAHNQYLQTGIGLGLAGIILLVLSVMLLMFLGHRRHECLIAVFGVLVALNYLTEAMLERQPGVLFIAFFTAFFVAQLNLVKDKPTTC
ncbi:MAG: O-antigen ligase family protein [Sphingobacteriales bacterium JAD_PAG50586_3]|nr:MAG: O-antigen ligase family protein [Sphingobacteriales bacterium JAD_PAG50586_3]